MLLYQELSKTFKELVLFLATSMPITGVSKKDVMLDLILYIYYLLCF